MGAHAPRFYNLAPPWIQSSPSKSYWNQRVQPVLPEGFGATIWSATEPTEPPLKLGFVTIQIIGVG